MTEFQSAGRLCAALTVAVSAASVFIAEQAQAQNQAPILEEVTVTAQRRSESADDISIAIQAFSGERLQNLGIVDVTDLALHTPGMTMSETGITGVPVYTIRGVGFDDYSSNSTSTVGVYEDEVSLPYPTMTRAPQFDLARVEVLKGPQGTLYGRNTTGGAINLVSNTPTADFAAGLLTSYDRFGTMDAEGYLNGELTDGVLGRVALRVRQSDEGWQKSSSRPGDTLGAIDQWAGRALLNWAPSQTFDITLKVAAYRDQSENLAPQYNTYVPLVPELADFFPAPPVDTRPDPGDNRSADWSESLRPERDNNGESIALTANWSLPGSTLTSITAYNVFDRAEVNDWDGSFVENLDVVFDTQISVFSQELRLASESDGDLQWMAGLYYADDEVDESWNALGSASTIYQGVFGAVDTR
jgi:iron complex outermembrane receptor protein